MVGSMTEVKREQIDSREERATALLSIRKADKEHLKQVAKEHGLTLSAFLRLAAEEYIRNHEW